MKTNKSLFTLILALTMVFSFSCEEKAETPDASSLVGTVWAGTWYEQGDEEPWTVTVSVLTSSTGTYLMESVSDIDPGTFTYTYTPPKVVFTAEGESMTATISGNTLTVESMGMTLTKQ